MDARKILSTSTRIARPLASAGITVIGWTVRQLFSQTNYSDKESEIHMSEAISAEDEAIFEMHELDARLEGYDSLQEKMDVEGLTSY